MPDSRVADAIDGLVALLTPAVAPVVLLDGPFLADEALMKVVGIGYDGDNEGDFAAVVDWEQEVVTMDGEQDESFAVLGYAASWSGNADDTKARRDEAFALLSLIQNAVNGDPTLGGLPVEAEFATGQLFQDQGKNGQQARITFTIMVRAL